MTDGSSQGLFVVVAVVIFGIFVAIAYTIFEDNLRPALSSVFNIAIEQTNDILFSEVSLRDWKPVGTTNDFEYTETGVIYSTDGYGGIVVDNRFLLRTYKNYRLSFDIQLLEGRIYAIGGHLLNSDHLQSPELTPDIVKIDGVVVEGADWKINTAFYEFDNEVHNVEVLFTTDGNTFKDERLYIQPNRYFGQDTTIKKYDSPYKVEIANLELEIIE